MSIKPITIVFMSGVEDGRPVNLHPDSEGKIQGGTWTLTIGRKDDNDLCLRNDTFVSRYHAKLYFHDNTWELEDLRSTNGSFIEGKDDTFDEKKFEGKITLEHNQLFRLGRTWLRIQTDDADLPLES